LKHPGFQDPKSPRASSTLSHQNSDFEVKQYGNPVQIKLNAGPGSVGDGYAHPSTLNEPSTNMQETNIDSVFAEDEEMEFGNTVVKANVDDEWTVEKPQGNEFFSADEQARIWQELREAENKATTNEPSAAEKAKVAAKNAKGDRYIVPEAPVNVVNVSGMDVYSDPVNNSNDAPFDLNTEFSATSPPTPPPILVPAVVDQGPGYIDPNNLAEGQSVVSYLDPAHVEIVETNTAQVEDNDDAWWK